MEAALGILSSQGAGEEDEINRVLEASTTAPQDLHHQQAYKQEEIDVKIENGRACQENDEAKSSSPKHKDLSSSKQISATTNIKGSSMEPDHSVASTSSQKEQDYQIESARAEMGEVREENQRLKKYLDRIMGDYNTLQMQFHDIQQKSAANKSRLQDSTSNVNHQDDEESDLVSLSLGSFSSKRKKVDEKNVKNPSYHQGRENESDKESLSLGLDSCKYEPKSSTPSTEVRLSNPSPASSLEEVPKGEEAGETWPPRKVAKTMRSIEDDIAQQNPLKKARVSVRARCDTPTMNDGCQWRKYGQKIAKGNPCPRAYYRCTIAPSCPVRKQVQRCAEDMPILITTYEGAHNHPLPMAATAMASTTSAAASMLLSGSSSSSSSQSGLMNPASAAATTTTTAAGLHGYNFYLSDNSKSRFFIPNSSMSSALPTITLDLTSNPSSSSPSSSHFNNKFSSSHHQIYPPTSLNFGSSDPNTMSWSNGFLSYGNGTTQPYNKNQMVALSSLGRQQPIQNTIYQNYMQKNNNNNNINPITSIPTHHQQQFQADPIAAATKAITADPSFQSALAAALTSIIGNSGGGGSGSTGLVLGNQAAGGDHINHMAQKFKWGEQFPGSSSTTASSYLQTAVHQKGNVGCASSYLNKTTTSSANMSQAGSNLVFSLPPSLPFSSSTPKSASASPGDTRDHNN